MLDHSSVLAIVTALLTVQPVGPARAGHGYFEGPVAGVGPAETARDLGSPHPLPADSDPVAEIGWQPSGASQPPRRSPTLPSRGDHPGMRSWPRGTAKATSWERPIRLPRVEAPLTNGVPNARGGFPPGQHADGTWREDGRYIIIDLNGQQLRLVKESRTTGSQSAPNQTQGDGGTVCGRLLHKRQPLANCRVVIRPMIKTFGGHALHSAAQPLRTTTDAQGVYRFQNVPPGRYKLSWLPEATNRWVRRIAMRPDFTVRAHETTHVKDVPVALRTIN